MVYWNYLFCHENTFDIDVSYSIYIFIGVYRDAAVDTIKINLMVYGPINEKNYHIRLFGHTGKQLVSSKYFSFFITIENKDRKLNLTVSSS